MKTFKQAFCDHFNYAPQDYVREAFIRTVHARALLTARWQYRLGFAECCWALLDEAGETTNEEDLLDVIKQCKYDELERGSTCAQRWKFRVSSQRLLELNAEIRKAHK